MSEIKKLIKEKLKAIDGGKFKEAAEACNALGVEYSMQEKYDEALQEHVEELRYSEMIGDELDIAMAHRKIGECYCSLNNFKEALFHIKKYFDASEKLKNDLEIQRAYTTYGRTYYQKHQIKCTSSNHNNCTTLMKAELASCKALQLLPSLSSTTKPVDLADMKCRLLLNLGLIYETKGEREMALKNVKGAFDIAVENNIYEIVHKSGYALSSLYQKLGKHLEAETILSESLKATKKLHNKTLICEVQLSRGINLICLENYAEAKKCLKSAYKMRSAQVEDFALIAKSLKVCIGVEKYEKRLKTCTDVNERKSIFEKIADALATICCYKPAIKNYLLTLDYIPDEDKRTTIYYSLGQTYLDDGNVSKALEYFEKEYNSNKGKPLEQVTTLLKMAEIFEGRNDADRTEQLYMKAVSLSEAAKDKKHIHVSLSKLLSFYNSNNKTDRAELVKKKLDGITLESSSEEEENEGEESQDPFSDVNLSDMSDSDDGNEEVAPNRRKRAKRIDEKKNDVGETPLHRACIDGNLKLVKRLVETGHSLKVTDNAGWTPLHEACNLGYYEIVEYLIDSGADINDPGGSQLKGLTPLHDAASCGNFDVMRLLMSKGASVAAVNGNGDYPLTELLKWKKRSRSELDDATLKQCEAVEEELKSKMVEAGINLDYLSLAANASMDNDDSFDVEHRRASMGEKRKRSPAVSSENDSGDEIDDDTPPYFDGNTNRDCDGGAEAEYRSVMESLRRSAADINLAETRQTTPRVVDAPPLIDEDEVVTEWLIKDTNEIPRTKSKRRKRNKLNVRTSKCIDNFLIPQDSADTGDNQTIILHDEDDNISISSISSSDRNSVGKPEKVESSRVSFCLRVNIAEKLILVPVPEDTCTVDWLKEAAATRFQKLDGRKPHLSLIKNGALLSGDDLVKTIFSDNEEVLSSVDMWHEPSLEDKYVTLCSKHNAAVSSSVKEKFQCVNTSYKLDFSNANITNSHLSIILSTMLNYKNLQHLNFSCVNLSNANMNELVSCVPNFSNLITLNLSCCGLTSRSIKVFVDYLSDQMPRNSVLPSLKVLDLSYNMFSSCSQFDVFFRLNSLVTLNLSSCGLSSAFLSNRSLEALSQKQNLEELNISGNIFKEDEISKFLRHLPRNNLRKLNLQNTVEREAALGFKLQNFFSGIMPYLTELNLQGCFLTDADADQIAEGILCCKELKIVDLSVNPSLSSNSIRNFIKKVHENNLSIAEININSTCLWNDNNVSTLVDFLKLRTLRRLCFDSCPEDVAETVMQKWTDQWGTRAICSNFFYFELSIK